MKRQNATETTGGYDKVKHYKWDVVDKPGQLMWVNKSQLNIDDSYQRDEVLTKVLDMASKWSHVACGVIRVARRPDGSMFIMDGQHRYLAAMRRSDIDKLPCIVFDVKDSTEEAKGFLVANTLRKPVDAFGKHKAKVTSGDEIAVYVNGFIKSIGLTFTSCAVGLGQIKCIAWCEARATENKSRFERVMRIAADLSEQDREPVHRILLDGLWVLDAKIDGGILESRVKRRLFDKGSKMLVLAATKAAAYFAKSGCNVWASGMLSEMNKGLRNKLAFSGDPDHMPVD